MLSASLQSDPQSSVSNQITIEVHNSRKPQHKAWYNGQLKKIFKPGVSSGSKLRNKSILKSNANIKGKSGGTNSFTHKQWTSKNYTTELSTHEDNIYIFICTSNNN